MDKPALGTDQTERTVKNVVLIQEIPAEHQSLIINHEKKMTEEKTGN